MKTWKDGFDPTGDIKSYEFDWSDLLAGEGDDTITGIPTITLGDDAVDDGLEFSQVTVVNSATGVSLLFNIATGEEDAERWECGETYTVTCAIDTAGGKSFQKSALLTVKNQ